MAYLALGLVPPSTDISFHAVAPLVFQAFPGEVPAKKAQRTVEDGQLTTWIIWLEWPDWKVQIRPVAGTKVLEFANKVASVDPSRQDNSVIASCDRLIEVQGTDDANMDHFNDYVFVLQALENLPGVVLFDPRDVSFI